MLRQSSFTVIFAAFAVAAPCIIAAEATGVAATESNNSAIDNRSGAVSNEPNEALRVPSRDGYVAVIRKRAFVCQDEMRTVRGELAVLERQLEALPLTAFFGDAGDALRRRVWQCDDRLRRLEQRFYAYYFTLKSQNADVSDFDTIDKSVQDSSSSSGLSPAAAAK